MWWLRTCVRLSVCLAVLCVQSHVQSTPQDNVQTLRALNADEKMVYDKVVSQVACPCNCPMTLSGCLEKKPQCRRAEILARYVLRAVQQKQVPMLIMTQISEAFELVFAGKKALLSASQQNHKKGAVQATVELVEFADFRCHHCKEMVPFLKDWLKQSRHKVQLAFKHFPIQLLEPSVLAAEAAEAAAEQGQFFAYHDELFAHQDKMTEADFIEHAKKLKLDVKKFTQQLHAHQFKNKVLADYEEGKQAGMRGTPALFVNGYEFKLERTMPNLDDFIEYVLVGMQGCQ